MVERPTGKDPRAAGNNASPDGQTSETHDEAVLAARLKRLGESLEVHRAAEEKANSRGRSPGFAQAIKVASEFVAGIAVGAGIGWLIDRMAGTSPWALIVFLLLGFAAGVMNVLRAEGVVAEAGIRAPSTKANTEAPSKNDEG